jgi:hypothetical protein
MTRRWRLGRHGALAVVAVGSIGVIAQGCLTRPVESSNPTTSTNFTTTVNNKAIDKIDLLFVIDNSASMGDKQEYLAQAVPQLITRLVTPNCVDQNGKNFGSSTLDAMGNATCPNGGKPEFPPVHDMHIGVISTALGTRLSDTYAGNMSIICDPSTQATVYVNGQPVQDNAHNDDKAELLNRCPPGGGPGCSGTMPAFTLNDAGSSNYLNWFPNNPKNANKMPSPGAPPITDPATLIADFKNLIQGVGVFGCGIESQLESWYRFLVQPDPYASLALNNGQPTWQGVDTTILKQRHDFLRPDSLVAIIDMTDENDSEIDVRSLGGTGYLMMARTFDPPRGTSGCAENSMNSGLVDAATCQVCPMGSTDPSCMMGTHSAANDWGYDANLRHVHMTQKYGLWPQYPIQRYVLGLTSPSIPDRRGEYPMGAKSYQGLKNQNCVNPLFAQNLPDGSGVDPNNPDLDSLCKLTRGPRTPDLVYYAHIGGVPHQLLQEQPGDPDCPAGTNPADCPQKESLVDADWVKILGQGSLDPKDPEHTYDFSGIDPHMLESYQPRPGIPTSPPGDNISGYDWITDQPAGVTASAGGHVLTVDREYACTFPLNTPRDCSQPDQQGACDCPWSAPMSGGLAPQEIPPICNPMNPTQQIGAKVYPTIRELLLAKLMKNQGFISSLCPIHVTPAGGNPATDPLYGYNPAVNGIVDRLKVALNNQCLPQRLSPDQCGQVPCLILVTMPAGQDCTTVPGLSTPPPDILKRFQDQQHQAWLNGSASTPTPGVDPSTLVTCQMQELFQPPMGAMGCPAGVGQFDSSGSCQNSKDPGWCYVEGPTAQALGCPQSILYSNGMPPNGATVSLQCIEQSISAIPDASPGGG